MSMIEWLDVAYKIGMAVFGVWLYLDRRNDKTNSRIVKLEIQIGEKLDGLESRLDDRLDDHSDRLVKVETNVGNQPTHTDLGKLYDELRVVSKSIADIATTQASNGATLNGVREQVSRMDSFWRNKQG